MSLETALLITGLLLLLANALVDSGVLLLMSAVLLPGLLGALSCYKGGTRGLMYLVLAPLAYGLLAFAIALVVPLKPLASGGPLAGLVAAIMIIVVPLVIVIIVFISTLLGGVLGLIARRLLRKSRD